MHCGMAVLACLGPSYRKVLQVAVSFMEDFADLVQGRSSIAWQPFEPRSLKTLGRQKWKSCAFITRIVGPTVERCAVPGTCCT